MSKLPAMQFYVGDWRKDPGVQSLDYETRGVWFEILCLMFESGSRGVLLLNEKPMPEDALARLLGLEVILVNQILTKLLTFGVASLHEGTGALMCRRMVRDENLRKLRKECGKMGGNPNLVNQNPTTKDKVKPTPSSSSSSSITNTPSLRDWKKDDLDESEIPSLEQAKAQSGNSGIPNDFIEFVYDDWFSRGGKDAGGVSIPWIRYIPKRWSREQIEWNNGTHRGKPKPKQSNAVNNADYSQRKI